MLAEHAERFHAVIAVRELRVLGFDAAAVRRRVLAGRLHPWYRGVYAIGHRRLTPRGRWLAAVLACGPRAVLSHRSAAALHGFGPAGGARPDVTVAGAWIRGPAGVLVHRSRVLTAEDLAVVDGIPVTSVARTLADLAEVADDRALARAVHESEVARVLDVGDVHAVAGRLNGRRGLRRLLALVAEPAAPTRSELEDRFLELCAGAGLPPPQVNVAIAEFVADFVWPGRRLVVETDGAAVHLTRAAFERDRARDATLTAAGWRVVRITWRQLTREPERVVAILRTILDR